MSPSLGASLLACKLAVALRLDQRFAFLDTPNTASVLGTVAHELAELTARGRFDDASADQLEVELQSAWLDTLTEHEVVFAAAHPLAKVPPAARWPGYEQTRFRTLTFLAAEAQSRHRNSPATTASGPLLEISLEHENSPLHGRADRIERTDAGVELIDLKTGWTLGDDLRPAHRRQLLAYAYLWHATHHEWPAIASIQRLDGTRIRFDVDPAEAEAVAAELVAAMHDFNATIEAADIAQLASPGPDVCRHCAYRAVCQPFFDSINPDWDWWRTSCIGTVTSIASTPTAARVGLDVNAGNIGAGPINITNFPPDATPPVGAVVAIVDATRRRPTRDLQLTWETSVCRWDPRAEDGSMPA